MFNQIRKKLRETTFDKIKVGEVFATLGCTNYFVKTSSDKALFVDTDLYHAMVGETFYDAEFYFTFGHNCDAPGKVYRVPSDVQERYYIR